MADLKVVAFAVDLTVNVVIEVVVVVRAAVGKVVAISFEVLAVGKRTTCCYYYSCWINYHLTENQFI